MVVQNQGPESNAELQPRQQATRVLCVSLSRHWEFLWLTFSGVMLCYTLRVNMSVAAQSMRDELQWSETQKGFVLSAFYWGYALGQIPASYLMMKGIFSPKWTFGFAVFIPSILTILVPLCARSSYTAALIIRMLIGFIESATFPSCYQKKEKRRGRLMLLNELWRPNVFRVPAVRVCFVNKVNQLLLLLYLFDMCTQ